MKLQVSQSYQNFLASMDLNFAQLMGEIGVPYLPGQESVDLDNLAYHRLLLAIDQRISDQQILALSDISLIQTFMPPFFAALSSQNGSAAIAHFAKYKKLTGPIKVSIQSYDNLVKVSYDFDMLGLDLPRFSLINEQLLLLSLVRTGTGQEIKPLSVSGPFAYEQIFKDYLDCPTNQSQVNEMIFRQEDLDIPFKTANNVMLSYLDPGLKQSLADMSQDISWRQQVQEKLFELIPSGQASLEDVAEQLHLSGRSLQRYLSAEGSKFKIELEAVQKMMTLNYLENPHLSTAEIAYLVGYSEVASFSRAFKKWTGQTLTQYRENQKSS